MGNNASTGSKVGGGFLTSLGMVLAFTPAGLFTSTWMIPTGLVVMSGKDEVIGVGITHTENDPQFHIGNPDTFLDQRRLNEKTKADEKAKIMINNAQEVAKLNASIKPFYPDYKACVDQIKNKLATIPNMTKSKKITCDNISQYMNTKFNIFIFASANQYGDSKYDFFADSVFSLLSKFKYNASIDTSNDKRNSKEIENIYVIRRNLGPIPFHMGWLAHSGLLLKTTSGEFYICEYGVENNQNAVSCYKLIGSFSNMSTRSEFTLKNGKVWKKQLKGSSVKNITVEQLKKSMEDVAWKHNYNMLFWNCHIVQETTKEVVGLSIEHKYLSDEMRNELEMFNSMM